MFDWIQSNPEYVLVALVAVVNMIFTILGYKRTGVLKFLGSFDQSILRQADTQKQADVVNKDLDNLIDYHEKTAQELKKLKTKDGDVNGKS